MDAVCGDTRRGDGPSIPPSATVLAAVTVAAASSEANNTRPPSSVGVDVTATAVTTAADVADDARYDHAVNVNGGPSPAALGDVADDGGGSEHVGASSCRVRHLERRKIILACVFRGSKVASEQGTAQGGRVLEWSAWGYHEAVSTREDAGCTSAAELQVGHSRCGRLRHRRRARRQTQLLPTLTYYRRPLHSVVQAHPSMPDTRSIVFCSYSSHLNDCIGDMAKTRRIAIAAFH